MMQFDVAIFMVNNVTHRAFTAVPVATAPMKAQGIDGLLGRDILNDCLLIYSGPEKTFTLSF